MKGIVIVDDGDVVHVIPRAEVRYTQVFTAGGEAKSFEQAGINYGDAWGLRYQLVGVSEMRTIEWRADVRPEIVKQADRVTAGEYNHVAATGLQAMLTRGFRDMRLGRRNDGIFFLQEGLVDDEWLFTLCRQFVTEMSVIALKTGDADRRQELLREIHTAAHDLRFPSWYPLRIGAAVAK